MTLELTEGQEKCLRIFEDDSFEIYNYKSVDFKTNNSEMAEHIKQEYIDFYIKKAEPQRLTSLVVNDDGVSDFVDVHFETDIVPFQRIRRVTGYLVGDMSRWNNGKRAEESDRVKHSTI